MTVYIPEYSLGNKMAVVAKNEDVFNELLSRNADIMQITNDRVVFYPEQYAMDADKINPDRLKLLGDYDIVEISSTGILYRAFANNEVDTTLFLGAKCNSNCIMCPAGDPERRNGFS